MAKTYLKVTSDDKLWLERDGDGYDQPARFITHTPLGPHVSASLTTFEIGLMAGHFARLYFARTGRVVWPVNAQLVEKYERALIDDAAAVVRQMKLSPHEDVRARAEARLLQASPSKPSCQFCDELGECTGDCI